MLEVVHAELIALAQVIVIDLVLAGDNAATLALARHGAATMLRIGQHAVAAVGLADAIGAIRTGLGGQSAADREAALFHDDEIDGPVPARVRTVALTLDTERAVVAARVAGLDDVDIVGAEDVPDAGESPVQSGRPEQQLAMLAVRLEMAATYLRLARG